MKKSLHWTPQMKTKLLSWFEENQRALPWRQHSSPYGILVSEAMLQQTTVTAVIPYYKNFMHRFPTIHHLASASEEDVLASWAGLGYYRRARYLWSAAKKISSLKEFPRSHSELIEFPGLGPYTARAISSIAFKEPVGVLDGNVIRILCRLFHLKISWWKSAEQKLLQGLSDNAVQGVDSSSMNQAMMELGATICTPQSPACFLCPLLRFCKSQKVGAEFSLPLAKPRREREIWLWKPQLYRCGNEIGFVKNDYAPFLKGQWIFPGSASRQKIKPQQYNFRHSITHHDIYIDIEVCTQNIKSKTLVMLKGMKGLMLKDMRVVDMKMMPQGMKWIHVHELERVVPFSLVKKTLQHVQPSG